MTTTFELPTSRKELISARSELIAEIQDIQNQLAYFKAVWESGIEIDQEEAPIRSRVETQEEYMVWRFRARSALSKKQLQLTQINDALRSTFDSVELLVRAHRMVRDMESSGRLILSEREDDLVSEMARQAAELA